MWRYFVPLLLLVSTGSQSAELINFGPLFIDPENPQMAVLAGPITPSLPLDFRRLLEQFPDVEVFALHSEGGDVNAGLLVAHEVASREIATFIDAESICFSACAYVFLAGKERTADGQLGVHQFYGGEPDASFGQATVADILDAMNEFGVPRALISDMLRTPPDQMRVYSHEEVVNLGINRSSSTEGGPVTEQPDVASTQQAPSKPGVTSVSGRPLIGPFEEWSTVKSDTTLEKALFGAGLIRSDFEGALPLLRDAIEFGKVPIWTRLRVYWVPYFRENGEYVGHFVGRIGIYLPTPPDGLILHKVTAALSDRGTFVTGLEPLPYVSDPSTESGSGRTNRAIPNNESGGTLSLGFQPGVGVDVD